MRAGPYGTGAGPPDPAWTSTLPNVARWLYETTGDARVAEDNYGAVVRWLTFYSDEAHASSTPGLIDISKWCDYLCMNILYGVKTKGQQPSLDFGLSDNKFFLDGLRTAASFAEVLGKSDDAARWRAQIANTSAAYARQFFHSGGSPASTAPGNRVSPCARMPATSILTVVTPSRFLSTLTTGCCTCRRSIGGAVSRACSQMTTWRARVGRCVARVGRSGDIAGKWCLTWW